MPTAATTSFSVNQVLPEYAGEGFDAPTLAVRITASTTLVAGTVLGEPTATPGIYAAYASGNSDGTQIPKGILKYDVIADASGNLTYGTTAGGGGLGETHLTVPMYVAGVFHTTDLTGFDANALSVLRGHYVSGVLADGMMKF